MKEDTEHNFESMRDTFRDELALYMEDQFCGRLPAVTLLLFLIFWNHRFVSRFISRDTKGQQFISLKTRKFRNLQQQTDSAFVKTLKSSSSMEGG